MVSQVRLSILAVVAIAVFGLLKVKARRRGAGRSRRRGCSVEYLSDPMGVDTPHPRFFWVPEHSDRGQAQTAYEIVVSTDGSAAEGDMWSTGKVAAVSPGQVAYAGKPLQSGGTYHWKVRYWDCARPSRVPSATRPVRLRAFFSDRLDGQWIGGKNQLRKEFEYPGIRSCGPRRSSAGLGYSELGSTDARWAGHVLDPAWTTYEKRALYVAYDVTGHLQEGANAVAVMLGQGWFKGLALLFQLDIDLEGGEKIQVVSDAFLGRRRMVRSSPTASITGKPTMPGWKRPAGTGRATIRPAGFAAEAVNGPKGVLSSQMMPAIEVTDTIVPLNDVVPAAGRYRLRYGTEFRRLGRARAFAARAGRPSK